MTDEKDIAWEDHVVPRRMCCEIIRKCDEVHYKLGWGDHARALKSRAERLNNSDPLSPNELIQNQLKQRV